MWHIDIQSDSKLFYYNMETDINDSIENEIGKSVANALYRSEEALNEIKRRGFKRIYGATKYGMIASFNERSQQTEIINATEMAGICATVSKQIAEEVLAKAKEYCPVKTGKLRDSGTIEDLGNGQCRIYFSAPYAFYVHEFTWISHKYPTCPMFLARAIQEVESDLGGI